MKKLLYLFLFFILCVIRTFAQDTLDSPILVDPPIEKDVVTNLNLTWTPVANATAYEVQVATDANFNMLIPLQRSEVNTTNLNIEPGIVQTFTKYYWRVKAKNSGFSSHFSTAFNFRTAGTAVQELNFLKAYIFNLVNGDRINQFKANDLLEKLNQAIDKVNANNKTGAIAKILQFEFKVSCYMNENNISYYDGNKMLDNSNGTIQILGGDNAISNENNVNVDKFALNQNYPNPFNPATVISYKIPDNGYVTLKIYNLLGEEIVTLINKYQEEGSYTAIWDASNLSSGIYIYRLESGSYIESKKMVLKK